MKIQTSFIILLLAALPMASAGGLKGARSSERRVLKDDTDTNPDDPDDINVDDILGLGCFSEDTTVQVEHQNVPVLMKDLKVGDRVLTTDHEYAPVYTFGHRLPAKKDVFVQVDTVNPEANLQMTGEHLVFVEGKSDPVRADSIQPGDILQTTEDSGARVVATFLLIREGLYAPITTKGTLVVDGIAASSYVSLQDHASEKVELNGFTLMSQHKFVHMSLSPLRMACLGISSRFCQHDETTTGMPSYISATLAVQQYSEGHHIYVQMAVWATWIVLSGVCMAVETAFGAAAAPAVIAFLAGLFFVARAMNIRVRCKVVFPRN